MLTSFPVCTIGCQLAIRACTAMLTLIRRLVKFHRIKQEFSLEGSMVQIFIFKTHIGLTY